MKIFFMIALNLMAFASMAADIRDFIGTYELEKTYKPITAYCYERLAVEVKTTDDLQAMVSLIRTDAVESRTVGAVLNGPVNKVKNSHDALLDSSITLTSVAILEDKLTVKSVTKAKLAGIPWGESFEQITIAVGADRKAMVDVQTAFGNATCLYRK